MEGLKEEITEALNTNNEDKEFEKRHVGGGLIVETDSGTLKFIYFINNIIKFIFNLLSNYFINVNSYKFKLKRTISCYNV